MIKIAGRPRPFAWGVFVVVLLVLSNGAQGEQGSPAPCGTFAEFLGVNGGPSGPPLVPSDKEIWKTLGWVRAPINWTELQPQGPTEWNEAVLEDYGKGVLHDLRQGVHVLPVLLYGNPWAARQDAWSYVAAGKRYEVAAFDGRLDQRRVKITDLANGQSSTGDCATSIMPPQDVADWERYVEHVVAFLSKPPYQIEFFQIWNEANDAPTGFWNGNMELYMERIHAPAARIIHKYGAKVVYGGYPCNGDMSQYLRILDENHAWDTVDVLDTHYFGLIAWQQLYDRVKNAAKPLGIWQTEVGFVTSPAWVPDNYPRFFHWALSHDWQPDRYKIFQFAYWSPDDPKAFGYDCCFLAGDRYTCHGKALATLGPLLSGTAVQPYDAWQATPALSTAIEGPSIEGFRCGERIVLAVHLTDRSVTQLELRLRDLGPQKAIRAWRVGVYGSQTPLEVVSLREGNSDTEILVRVPVADPRQDEQEIVQPGTVHTFYLSVELSPHA